MKKIININLSGRVIPIEDSAYEKLKSYIDSLRRYFVKEEDRDEIINDIESRIAELMNDKIRKGAPCITDADIDEIAASMGRPEDFEADAEAEKSSFQNNQGTAQQAHTGERRSKRLYRDTSDKFVGGVCSGMAAYLNIDPAIVRILFAIVTFGGFGLGFVVYILLWIILPAREVEGFSGKRLFRNPDDRVIGGVAGGLAAYFNRETWVIRLILAAPFLFSIFLSVVNAISWHGDFGNFFPNIVFGSLGSTFVVTYIILWMVLPEARSPYEKMEMRGEKVDVNTIRQNMKDRVKDWADEVKDSAQNLGQKAREFSNTRGKAFATEVGNTARRGGSGLGHAIGVLFKVFFIFIAGTIAFGLFVGLMALMFGGIAWWPINNFLWTSKAQQLYAWGTIIFFMIVPLVGFIIWLIRRIIGVRSRTSYLGWTFGCLWTVGWVSMILLVTSLANDLAEYDKSADREVQISQPANGRLLVAVTDHELEYTGRFGWVNDGGEGWDLSPDTLKLSMVDFELEKSIDSMYHVTTSVVSLGRTKMEARTRADNVQYSIVSHDSVLDLANGYSIAKEDKFRGQRVRILIKIPVGKKIHFDESVVRKLNPASVSYRGRLSRRNADLFFENRGGLWYRTGVDLVMQADGDVKEEGSGRVIKEGYRYVDSGVGSAIDDKPRPQEKKDKKQIKEGVKEQVKTVEKSDSVESEKMEDAKEETSMVFVPLPSISMVRTFF